MTEVPLQNRRMSGLKDFATYWRTETVQTYLWKLVEAIQLNYRRGNRLKVHPSQKLFLFFRLELSYENCELTNCMFIVYFHTRVMQLTCLIFVTTLVHYQDLPVRKRLELTWQKIWHDVNEVLDLICLIRQMWISIQLKTANGILDQFK